MDYEKVIHGLVDPLIEHPESIMVRELPGSTEKDVALLIVAEDDDTARDSNCRIHLKFESFDEDKKDNGED